MRFAGVLFIMIAAVGWGLSGGIGNILMDRVKIQSLFPSIGARSDSSFSSSGYSQVLHQKKQPKQPPCLGTSFL